MDFVIDFWNQYPILSVLSSIFGLVPWILRLSKQVLYMFRKVRTKVSGRKVELKQWQSKLWDILSRPASAVVSTIRFGLSYWFPIKKDKKFFSTYTIYISSFDSWYTVWLKNNSDLELERNDNFRTFKEARESVNQVLWSFTILYEQTDNNWIHVIAIKSDKLTLSFLNETSKKLNKGFFCHKLINKQREYFSLPLKEERAKELLNL